MTEDISNLTPEQAGAKLAEMTAAYRSTQPVSPQDKLTAFYGDQDKRAKLEAGDPSTRREFDELAKAAAVVQDPVAAAMAGALPEVPSSELRQMSELTAWLRADGFSEDVITSYLSNEPQTQAFKDEIARGKQRLLGDPEWVKKWMSGDPFCKKQMQYANMIATLPTVEKAA